MFWMLGTQDKLTRALQFVQELPGCNDSGQSASVPVLDGSIRKVEQVTVDGHQVGSAAKSAREPHEILVVGVGTYDALNHRLGRISHDFGPAMQPAHVLGGLLVGEVPTELLSCQDRLKLVEQSGRDDEIEVARHPASEDLPRRAFLGDSRADQNARV